jgi:hypothetical protein
MTNFYIIEEGEFTHSYFLNKVTEAKNRVISENYLTDYEFNMIRNSPSITVTTNGRSFEGRYFTYEVTNGENIIGSIDCFMDHHNTYIDISAKRL